MARRLTTNQEIAGSIPASINTCDFFDEVNHLLLLHHATHCRKGCCQDFVRLETRFAFVSTGCGPLLGLIDVLKQSAWLQRVCV
jgi:hypothetical protein